MYVQPGIINLSWGGLWQIESLEHLRIFKHILSSLFDSEHRILGTYTLQKLITFGLLWRLYLAKDGMWSMANLTALVMQFNFNCSRLTINDTGHHTLFIDGSRYDCYNNVTLESPYDADHGYYEISNKILVINGSMMWSDCICYVARHLAPTNETDSSSPPFGLQARISLCVIYGLIFLFGAAGNLAVMRILSAKLKVSNGLL